MTTMAEPVRLQKVLAAAGVGSRRGCEELIADGPGRVDGEASRTQGTQGRPGDRRHHASTGSGSPPAGRARLPGAQQAARHGLARCPTRRAARPRRPAWPTAAERLFHVGRLDADTEGLLLLTNDGELAHRLRTRRYEVREDLPRRGAGPVRATLGRRLRAGIELDDGVATVDRVPRRGRRAGQGDGRGRDPRGPQARRPPAARQRSGTRCGGSCGRRSGRSASASCRRAGCAC